MLTLFKRLIKSSLQVPLKLARQNYHFAKFYYMYEKGRELKQFSGPPLIIYQMGKVGSSSIRNSLFRCGDPSTRLVLMSHEFFPIRNRDLSRIDIEPEYRDDVIREIEHDRRVFQQFPL